MESLTRRSELVERSLNLSFLSPAFLGGADQKGQYRTPPFKALLREWWRVAVAPENDYDWKKILEKERPLFGSVSGGARQSQVRLRLKDWDPGEMNDLDKIQERIHRSPSPPLNPGLYLGYGPISNDNGKLAMKSTPAIFAKKNTLEIYYPKSCQEEMERTLLLIQAFGTLGGRSHNGWGSVDLFSEDPAPFVWGETFPNDLTFATRSLEDCLRQDWPTAIGCDERGPLVWRVKENSLPQQKEAQQKEVLKRLALLREGVNQKGKIVGDVGGVIGRELLSYPIVYRDNRQGSFGREFRLPSPLRFKVVKGANGTGGTKSFGAIVYHMPFSIEKINRENQRKFWAMVHRDVLDNHESFTRIGRGGSIG